MGIQSVGGRPDLAGFEADLTHAQPEEVIT
jgi:hypothetical protein